MNDIILSNKEVNHMTNSKKPSEPVEEERWAEVEELDRKMEEEEAEHWARIERIERNADLMSYLSLAFSIIALLIILVK